MPQVATLQLELEFIYGSLEDEVLDIAPESLSKTPNGLLARSGTSDEVRSGPLTLLLMLALLRSLALHRLAPTISRIDRPCQHCWASASLDIAQGPGRCSGSASVL